MKKEDFTTRLLKLFFHIQGPFDEYRQEMIYKACARALIQIVYSSHSACSISYLDAS